MSTAPLKNIADSFRTCCSGVKSFLFTRLNYDPDSDRACEIKCDLTDKNTFFAWQRNHMANERTFLSWCRTGIALIGFGFVMERFDVLIRRMRFLEVPGVDGGGMQTVPSTGSLGITIFALGLVIIVLAGWRFFYLRKHINNGDTKFSVLPDTFLLSSVLLTVAASFVFFAFYF